MLALTGRHAGDGQGAGLPRRRPDRPLSGETQSSPKTVVLAIFRDHVGRHRAGPEQRLGLADARDELRRQIAEEDRVAAADLHPTTLADNVTVVAVFDKHRRAGRDGAGGGRILGVHALLDPRRHARETSGSGCRST